jgi:hypothetical protein
MGMRSGTNGADAKWASKAQRKSADAPCQRRAAHDMGIRSATPVARMRHAGGALLATWASEAPHPSRGCEVGIPSATKKRN